MLILLSGVIVVSYQFSIVSNYIKLPSVLLLAAGIMLREISNANEWQSLYWNIWWNILAQ
ncbi:hypothetical protein [Parafilimonas sp.]|uniref:hypothetical protein n=1 Tax=Parafilimonas sp. TaxID=1969739 RepID=UPI0039E6C361